MNTRATSDDTDTGPTVLQIRKTQRKLTYGHFRTTPSAYLRTGREEDDHLALDVSLDEAEKNVQLFVQVTYHVVLNEFGWRCALILSGSDRHVLNLTLHVRMFELSRT